MRVKQTPTIGLIGYGRFGQLLTALLSPHFRVLVYDPHLIPAKNNMGQPNVRSATLHEVAQCDTIFIAVPINQFEIALKALVPYLFNLDAKVTIIDVCSVKIYPVNLMLEFLPLSADIIATHPLFGPDSINNPESRKIMMSSIRGSKDIYLFWKQFFKQQELIVIEMTPEQHDKLAAKSQSITHFIGRVLQDAQFETTGIDTKGFQNLLKLKEQTCHDSWELFLIYNAIIRTARNTWLNLCSRQTLSFKKY